MTARETLARGILADLFRKHSTCGIVVGQPTQHRHGVHIRLYCWDDSRYQDESFVECTTTASVVLGCKNPNTLCVASPSIHFMGKVIKHLANRIGVPIRPIML